MVLVGIGSEIKPVQVKDRNLINPSQEIDLFQQQCLIHSFIHPFIQHTLDKKTSKMKRVNVIVHDSVHLSEHCLFSPLPLPAHSTKKKNSALATAVL